jgi:glycosyltransferase involved in cell wall biosynthesis
MSQNIRDLVKAEFHREFYLSTYPNVEGFEDPIDHFLTVGWIQGRDPSPHFSTFNYLTHNNDVLMRRINPFVHYLLVGREAGQEAFPHVVDDSLFLPWESDVADLVKVWFDEDYYLKMNPDLTGARSLLTQYLVIGWVEGRDPSPTFSTHKYLWRYSDVWLAGENPFVHYLRIGRSEGREADAAEGSRLKILRRLTDEEWLEREKTEFDPEFYIGMYPSLRGIPDLFEHFKTTGWLEGRDPNANFSVRKYLSKNIDVRDAGKEPFLHYLRHGVFEGRESYPSEAVPEAHADDQPTERTDEDALLKEEFDDQFYLANYSELAEVEDLFDHYMRIGWKQGKNPSKHFDTAYYLRNEGDIRVAGINPFRHYILHGRREGRRGFNRVKRDVTQQYFPKITVIVPNYNHAQFLPQRLQSIIDQNYPNLELLLLDDCSSDNSREVLAAFAEAYSGSCKLVFNKQNSGNVFAQWQRGLDLAAGELIWICESDDTCDAAFLENIVYLFQDPSVRLAFGDIQFIDRDGNILDGMTHMRESAEAGIWNEPNVMPAAKWFGGPLAVRNLIANVGGAVFRKPALDQQTWNLVQTFKVAGDWMLYLIIARSGQIGYAPYAKAYFRQHGDNTSVTAFERPSFYQELGRFHLLLRQKWDVPLHRTLCFYQNLFEVFSSTKLKHEREISDLVSIDRLMKTNKERVHIAVSFLNFDVGGGEIFPINMLNALHDRGYMVSAVVQTLQSNNHFVREWLNPEIPIYSAELCSLSGPELAKDAGFDIIHSHNIWSEFFFLTQGQDRPKFKYFSTLHGSYEVSFIQREQIIKFFDQVTWVYTADRNLEKFVKFGLNTSKFHLIPNGIGRKLSANPVTRLELGISDSSIVFLFAARSHPEKGWAQVAAAFDRLCGIVEQDITLLMGGSGPEADVVATRYGSNARIKLLGFRSDFDDLLELSNFLVLPTRFAGESMPLTIIQAILARVPVISTDIGQIKNMLECESGAIGVTIPPERDDDRFTEILSDTLKQVIANEVVFPIEAFDEIGRRFSIDACLDRYLDIYGIKNAMQEAVVVKLKSTRRRAEATINRRSTSHIRANI